MAEQTNPNSERRTHPDVHEREKITDPKRLAELVLNTLNLTFDYNALQIDEKRLLELAKNPDKNWEEIVKAVNQSVTTAIELRPQIDSIDKALVVIAYHPEEGLPTSKDGDIDIVDRRGVEQLLFEKSKNTVGKWDQRTDLTDEQAYKDPVRSLALFIRRFQEDTVVQRLSIVEGWGKYIVDSNSSDPDLGLRLGKVIVGMNEAQKYAQYGNAALQTFVSGNLPDQETIKTVTSGGTKEVMSYLDTFAPPLPPPPGQN